MVAIRVAESDTAATGSTSGASASSRVTASRTRNASSATTTRMGMGRQYSRVRRSRSEERVAAWPRLVRHRLVGARCARVPQDSVDASGASGRAPGVSGAMEDARDPCTRAVQDEETRAPEMGVVGVLTVDDDDAFRGLAARSSARRPASRVVGEAACGEDGVRWRRRCGRISC